MGQRLRSQEENHFLVKSENEIAKTGDALQAEMANCGEKQT